MGMDLKLLAEQEQTEAFGTVCRQTTVDLVFASRDQGNTTDSNVFLFSRTNVTYKAEQLPYSCARQSIVWRDQIALIVEVSGNTASTGEMYDVAADAWAERITQAQELGAVQAGAS